jgi:xanthine dehydrogenase YagS FAD-binding subunit
MPLAGGRDLLTRLKDYVAQPDRIVNVKAALDATVSPMPGGGLNRCR